MLPAPWFFASDLHGSPRRYQALFDAILRERPAVVLLGGDLLPHALRGDDFVADVVAPGFREVRSTLGDAYPGVGVILGNDDPRSEEPRLLQGEAEGLWRYLHLGRVEWGGFAVYGYASVPPTPFRLKDWERYDVSCFVDPGCTPPEEGWHSVPFDERELRTTTIAQELDGLLGDHDQAHAIWLFHAPPYRTALDRAALDGQMVDHAPVDVHVGSIAVDRAIRARQPRMTLHGHVHESARLTGAWRVTIGETVSVTAAHDGDELALVRFHPADPSGVTRELL